MVEMEKSLLKKLCRDHDLYVTPSINDKLYLHYKGFRCIKNLDEYTGLKVLWLEGNGLPRIEGLEHQKLLKTLYLQENLIHKIENLDMQSGLDTLNLSQNQISCIENLGHMKELTSLSLKSNYLATAQDIEHVLELPNLSVLDVQSNRIADPDVLEVFAKMPNLKVLYLQGNDVVKHIKQYRKTLVYRCRKLKYLDDRPVFDDERRRIDAWGKALDASNGDYKAAQEAERVEMEAIRQEKKDRDRMNFLHFEQLMAEGRRKRAEEAEKATQQASPVNNQTNQEPQPVEINPFSGEKIVPVQDCEFLQRQREQRWEQVVNAPDVWSSGGETTTVEPRCEKEQVSAVSSVEDNQAESAASAATQVKEVIPVDASRLALLHQCATVGAGAIAARDAFVDSAFQTVEVAALNSGLLPPPAPVTSSSGQRETKERAERVPSSQQTLSTGIPTAQVAELMPPATQLINCAALVVDAEEAANATAAPASSSESASAVVMPPPAPITAVTKASTHTTDVNELD